MLRSGYRLLTDEKREWKTGKSDLEQRFSLFLERMNRMLRVKVICIGRLKEPYLRDACAEYQKRLSSFCRLEVEELAPARVPEAASDAQIAAALAQEGERILAQIPSSAYVYAMCIEGKQRGSEQFSAELTRLTVEGVSSVCFLIGGSWGLSEAAKARAQAKLSMSQMTFPHQLARVMLLEQLYRAFEIGSGGKYHK